MSGERVRQLRESLGLTQGELAARAGVSRQLIGALETGRHLPRVDAAISIAATLGVSTDTLFKPTTGPVDVVSGTTPLEGALVRLGRVGDTIVTDSTRVGEGGWDVADAIYSQGEIQSLMHPSPGVVMAGCEPGLEALERMLRENGVGALSVSCSSSAAISALSAGRAHAAVVHADHSHLSQLSPTTEVTRFRLCSWRVGLASPAEIDSGWFQSALTGARPVIQREPGAGVQTAFERIAGTGVPGPVVGGHLEAARLAKSTGMPAVTIEPAALATGVSFHPLEIHEAEIWVSTPWLDEPAVMAALNEVSGDRFLRRLGGVGGYDLEGAGNRAA